MRLLSIFASAALLLAAGLAEAAPKPAKFNAKGEALLPTGYREWVYVGTPLTPNALNGGAAPFPEYHNVYVEPGAYAEYKKNGAVAAGNPDR